ncbi:hypothetical protein HanXRQr2_Chr10g0444031 [Helianthus annuus]|nr:hypothetical protein HanXRQr2_Chr10g0444031 [Helianthus annuus]
MEGLEFDFKKSLWELMEGNECFENGKIQEVDIVQETIGDEVIDESIIFVQEFGDNEFLGTDVSKDFHGSESLDQDVSVEFEKVYVNNKTTVPVIPYDQENIGLKANSIKDRVKMLPGLDTFEWKPGINHFMIDGRVQANIELDNVKDDVNSGTELDSRTSLVCYIHVHNDKEKKVEGSVKWGMVAGIHGDRLSLLQSMFETSLNSVMTHLNIGVYNKDETFTWEPRWQWIQRVVDVDLKDLYMYSKGGLGTNVAFNFQIINGAAHANVAIGRCYFEAKDECSFGGVCENMRELVHKRYNRAKKIVLTSTRDTKESTVLQQGFKVSVVDGDKNQAFFFVFDTFD